MKRRGRYLCGVAVIAAVGGAAGLAMGQAAGGRPAIRPRSSTRCSHASRGSSQPATPPVPPAAARPPVTPRHAPLHRPPAAVNIAKQTRVNIAWQVALEAADFSPGVIDGHFQRKSLMALNEFKDRFFPGASPFDLRVFKALKVEPEAAITTYTVTEDDAAQVGGALPEDWLAKSRLDKLRYESLADCITEKFHVSRVLLGVLNPGVRLEGLEPGQTLNVTKLRPIPEGNKPTVTHHNSDSSYVTVNLGEKTIRIFDKKDDRWKWQRCSHCSIARDKAKLPAKDTIIKNIAAPEPQLHL